MLVLGSHAMHDGFAVIRWDAAGIGPVTTSLLWSESVVGEVVVFLTIGPVAVAKLGPAGAMMVAAAAGTLRWAVAGETADVLALALVQPLHGLSFALLHLACMRLIAKMVPPGLAGTAQAVYGTGVAVASMVLTLASGVLYGAVGARGFWAMSGICVLALPVALGCARQRKPAAVRHSGAKGRRDFHSAVRRSSIRCRPAPHRGSLHPADTALPLRERGELAFPGERMGDDGGEIVVLRPPSEHGRDAVRLRHDPGRIARPGAGAVDPEIDAGRRLTASITSKHREAVTVAAIERDRSPPPRR